LTKSTKRIESLARLNRQARERAFDVEDIDWRVPVDRAKNWIPEDLAPLSFAPSYGLLDTDERQRYNQLFALGTCEQFILFEQAVIRALACILDRCTVPAELRESLGCFVAEEQKHIEMFWRLLEICEPDFYATRTAKLACLSGLPGFLLNRAVGNPRLLLAWIWLTIFLEERTLFVSRRYIEARRSAPDSIDALHAEVHAFHFRDEVRHCQIDQHLLDALYDPQPTWKRKLCGMTFVHALRAFVFPSRTTHRILDVLGSEHSRLRERIIPRLLAELPEIGRDVRFHRRLFSRGSLPRTLRLLSQYPEHAAVWRMLPVARREQFAKDTRRHAAVAAHRR
jgi:hypothetical protein